MQTLLIILAFIFALVLQILGIFIGNALNPTTHDLLSWFLGISCAMSILLPIGNLLLRKRYLRTINRMDEKSLVQYLTAHREEADATAQKKLALLKRLRLHTGIYTVILLLLSTIIAVCSGALYDTNYSILYCLFSAVIALSVFSRIRFPQSKALFTEDKCYVSETDYPELYALAKKAASCFHCSTKIKIAILSDFNAGIAKIGDTYSLQLGAIMLNTLSKEELFSVLLHEFSHVAEDAYMSEEEVDFHNWLDRNENTHFLSWLTSSYYCYVDEKYMFEYSLYHYAASLLNETASDQSMTRYTTAAYAGSALLKTKYYDLFCYEKYTYDEVPPFAPEVPPNDILQQELAQFHAVMPKRMEFWNHLVDSEILARSASHPTLKMRLESLGIHEYAIAESKDTDSYRKECEKALHYIDELLTQEHLPNYEKEREEAYLRPKQVIENWEKAGKPLVAEEYADIVYALRQLGRYTESIQLCERAITELSDVASVFAYFMKGSNLLHQYDDSGLAYIYHAIEYSSDYIDEGMELIGEFCCLTGNQKELDIYREKAVELAQKERDVYDHLNYLDKKDVLTSENLPDGMLEQILQFIHSTDKDHTIQTIYLVRKTVSEGYFTSAFVIRFEKGTLPDTQNDIMHKIYRYLDTCSEWQFSLFNYLDVYEIKFDKIEGSCVYTKNA